MNAWRTPEMEERQMRLLRKAALGGAGMMSLFSINDLFTGGTNAAWAIAVRVVWGLTLVFVGLALPKASLINRGRLVMFVALVSGAGMACIAGLRGGPQSPYFAFLIAIPFCLVVMARDDVPAVTAGCASTFIGAAVILVLVDTPLGEEAQWLLCVATSCGLAIFASAHHRGHLREEFEQNRARLDALDRLAQSEKQLAQSERLALVGRLAGGVAHEINNPLGFVISNLEFLEAELNEPTVSKDERTQVILETQVGLRRIKGIVRDLTAFSRDGTDKPIAVDLREVVSEAERLAALKTHGRVGVLNELPADLCPVLGNPVHLSQVFLNLFINAADALGTRADGKIWIRARSVDGRVHVEVDDNGPGFADAVLPSLFQPFFTTKAPGKGTGLGLATSREYLRQAGGDLHAMPRPEGGARFTLAMRCAPPPA